jgi:hypothetical protein
LHPADRNSVSRPGPPARSDLLPAQRADRKGSGQGDPEHEGRDQPGRRRTCAAEGADEDGAGGAEQLPAGDAEQRGDAGGVDRVGEQGAARDARREWSWSRAEGWGGRRSAG